MRQDFFRDGLSFHYPDDWRLELEPTADGWTATVQSPGTAFAVIQLDRTLPEPAEMVRQALETLRGEYPTLDAEATIDTIAGEMALGHDIEFISLDMVNSCRTRAFYGLAGTVFVLCQSSGVDPEDYDPALRGIIASMRSEEE
ncbi:MAG: hypothetical protein U0736_07950 [Gemmataceae bacterium]